MDNIKILSLSSPGLNTSTTPHPSSRNQGTELQEHFEVGGGKQRRQVLVVVCTLYHSTLLNMPWIVRAIWTPCFLCWNHMLKRTNWNSFGLAFVDSANYLGKDDPLSKR